MYSCYDIVWGIPYTKEIALAANRAEGYPDAEVDMFDYEYLEPYGFEFVYDGSGADETPGWWGISLDSGAYWEMDLMEIKSLEPTEDQRREVQEKFDELPDWIKAVAPPIGFYMIWGTS